jgi:VCBS repeat-containing protein
MVFDAAVADTASIVENAANVTGDVLSNDTGTGGKTVQGIAAGTLTGPLSSNVASPVTGTYGSLTVQANGSYDYALNNASSTVQALAAGQTATDTFTYTMKNGANTPFTSTLTVTVTGANDAPTAIADTNSIAEDAASITDNVLSNDTDPDTGDTKTVSAITGGTIGSAMTGAYGNLTLNADGSYTYALDNTNTSVQALGAGHSLTETFNYTMKDAADAASASTLTITINGTNDAPAVTSAGSVVMAPLQENTSSADNNGDLVSNLLKNTAGTTLYTETDASDTNVGIAITAADLSSSNGMAGTWQYHLATDTAGTWHAFPTVAGNNALLLPGNAYLRFVVTANATDDAKESGSVTLTYKAWDGSAGTIGGTATDVTGGTPTAFSSAGLTATLNVTPVNDVPSFTTAPTVTVSELNPTKTLTTTDLPLIDPDNTTEQVMYRVEVLPTLGTLKLNGAAVNLATLFTQQDVISGNLSYTYNGGQLAANTADSVRFSIRDGAGGVIGANGASGANPWATLNITILDNVNAQIAITGTTVSIPQFNNDPNVATITTPIALNMSDADGNTSLMTLTITSLPDLHVGILQYYNTGTSSWNSVTVGMTFTKAFLDAHPLQLVTNTTEPVRITNTPTADTTLYPNVYSTASFNVTASDNHPSLTPTTDARTVNITITPKNNPPTLVDTDASLTISGAGPTTMVVGDNQPSHGKLDFSDQDSPRSGVSYTLTGDVAYGYLTLNGVRITPGQTFTQTQVDNGNLSYVCYATAPLPTGFADHFNFTLSDGDGATASGTFNIGVQFDSGAGYTPAPVDGINSPGTRQMVAYEGQTATIATLNLQGSTDYTIATLPGHGKITINGVDAIVGSSFTQSQIDNGLVRYVNDGTEPDGYGIPYKDSLTLTRNGGATGGTTFTFDVIPVNDSPTVTQAGPTSFILYEENAGGGSLNDFALTNYSSAVKLSENQMLWHDADTYDSAHWATMSYTYSAPAGVIYIWNGIDHTTGSWISANSFTTQQLQNGEVAYFHNPASETDSTTATFTLHDNGVTDTYLGNNTTTRSTGALSGNTVSLSFDIAGRHTNDAPAVTNTAFTVDQRTLGVTGQTSHIQVLTAAILHASDPDNTNSQLTYRIVSLGTKGVLQIDRGAGFADIVSGDLGTANAEFTYAMLTGGKLRYVANDVAQGLTDLTDSFTYSVTDPGYSNTDAPYVSNTFASTGAPLASNTGTVDITLKHINHPPVIVNNGPVNGLLEGGKVQITAARLGSANLPDVSNIVDAVDPDNRYTQVQYRINTGVAHGQLYIGDPITGALVKQVGVGSAFTLKDIQDGKIWYLHDGSEPFSYGMQDSFNYTVSDSSGMTEPSATFLINLVNVDDAPKVTGFGGSQSFTEDGNALILAPNATVTDVDKKGDNTDFNTGTLTVSLTDGAAHTYDQLAIAATGGITVSGANVSYTGLGVIGTIDGTHQGVNGDYLLVTFNSTATATSIQALARAVTFQNTEHANPDLTARNVQFAFYDGGATGNATDALGNTIANGNSVVGNVTVNVTRINDRPVLTAHTGGGNIALGTIGENDAAPTTYQVSSFIGSSTNTPVNPYSNNISGLGAIAGSADADNTHAGMSDVDVGAVSGIAITGLTNAATGVWQYSANGSTGWTSIGTVTANSALLLAPTYYVRFLPDTKDGGTATFTFKAWDRTSGTVGSKVDTTANTQTSAFSTGTDTAQIVVTPVNDAPTLTGIASNTVTVTEDTTFSFTGANAITLADVDSGSGLVKLTLTLTGSGTYGFSSTPASVGTNTDASSAPSLTGNTGTLILYGTQANLKAALGKLQYTPALDANQNNAAAPTLALTIDDQGYGENGVQAGVLTVSKTVTINITPANDTPTLTVAAGTLSVNENTLTVVANTIAIGDAKDVNDSNYANGTWSNPSLVVTALHGTLSLNAGAANLNGVLSNGNRTLTITSSRTGAVDALGDINSALFTNQYLQYTPDTSFSGIDTLTVTLHDNGNAGGTDKTVAGTISVSVAGINEAPGFAGLDATPTFAENGSSVVLDNNATISDPELSVYNDWGNAVLTLARSNGNSSDDGFSANSDDVFGASGTLAALTVGAGNLKLGSTSVGNVTTNSGGILRLTFAAGTTTAQVNSVLQQIAYSNSNNNPPGNAIIKFVIDDGNTNTGTHPQGASAPMNLTGRGSITVNITTTNDAPTLTGITAKSFTEDGSPVVIGTGATPSDPELSFLAGGNGQWGNAYLVLSRSGGAQAEDVFGASGTASTGVYLDTGNVLLLDGSAIGSYSNSSGTLTLTFADNVTTAKVQSALQGITYANTRQSVAAGANTVVTLNWVLHDGDTDGDRVGNGQGAGGDKTVTVAQTITVNGINDAPILSDTALAISQAEDATTPSGVVGTLISALAGAGNISDADTGASKGLAIVSADSTHGTWYYSTAATPSWTSFTATTATARLLAADANTRIYFKPTGDWHGSIAEALTIRAWDTTSGSNGGTADLSNAGSSTGGTTAFSTATDSVDLTITPVNDAPTLSGSTTLAATNEDTASSAATATAIASALTYGDATDDQTGNGGNSTATARTALAIVGNAATAGQGVWQYTTDGSNWNAISTAIGNTTAVVLDLGNSNHQIRFVPATDYNGTPGVLTLRVADGSWNSATGIQNINAAVGGTGAWSSGTGTLGISVNALNDAPTVSGLNATPTFVEGIDTTGNRTVIGTPIILDPSVTIGDIEIVTQAVDNFSGTTLTVARDNGSGGFSANAQDIFGLDTTGTVSIAGTVISVSGTAMADITGNSGGQLLITFRLAATSAQVNTVVGAVTYALNSDTPPANVTLRYRFNDDNQAAAQGSGGSLTGDATITVGITAQNDMPLAVDDTNAITEDATPNTATGNVITGTGSPNTTADSDPENDTLTITALRTGTEGAGGSTTAVTSGTTSANGTLLAGSYGAITLGADGSYSYALDNTNVTVNALRNGQSLTETFTYTLSDGHSGTDTAQITITISGNSDGAPSIVPADGNGAATGQVTVNESGLTGIGDTTETTTGSVTLSAADGLTDITVGGTTVTLTQLNALGSTPVVITTPKGAITLTGYTSTSNVGGVSTGGTLAYSYTLSQVQTTPAATENSDVIALIITDAGGGTANGTLTVSIVDDVPTAHADANSVNEGTTLAATTAAGNVFGATGATADDVADRIGADNTATPVTAVSFGGNAKTVGTAFTSTYGSLTLNADGSYSYALDNANVTVNALRNGQTLTETFTYTITDADGDTGSANLVITINGVTDGAPSIVPADGNGAATGQVTVNESGLTGIGDTTETTTGSVTLSAADGLTDITVGGTTVTLTQLNALGSTPVVITTPKGAITLTGYTSTSNVGGVSTGGTLAYSYTLSQVQTTPAATENSDVIALIITDAGGGTANGTLTVSIVDDVPTAHADANSVNEGTTLAATTAAGNVFGATGATADDVADRIGADNTATPVTAVSFGGNAKTVGTAFTSTYGSLTLNADGSYSYALDNANVTVNALRNGQTLTETFTYTITDADGDTGSANLVITINGINDAPVAKPDTNTVNENAILTVITANGVIQSGTVLTGVDTDVEGDTLTVIGVKTGIAADVAAVGTANIASALTGTYGTLTLAADGSYVYAADQAITDRLGLGVTAADTFSYAISDGNGGTAFTTLVITVTGTNDAPTTVGLLPPVTQADSTMVSLTTAGGFADPDSNNIFAYSASGLPAGLSIDATTGMISGTLAHDASQGGVNGVHAVVVTATDSQGVPVSQTFSFTVTNPAPVANPDSNAVNENSTLTVNAANGVIRSGGAPTGTDTDVDGDTQTVIGVKSGTAANAAAVGISNVGSAVPGTYGTLTLAADGSYTYQANAVDVSAIVTDTFSYAISDGNGGISFTTLVISVTGTSKAPNAPEGSIIQLANSPSSSFYTAQDSSTTNPTFTSTDSPNSGATITDGEDKSQSEGRLSTITGDSVHYELELTGSIKNQLVLENKEFSFRIPNGVFTHTNPNEHLSFKATSPSGAALPSWITFDPNTKTFSGIPPVGSKTETVLVIVKDSNGKEVRASFTIGVNKEDNSQTGPLRQNHSKPKIIRPQARISNFDTIPGKPGLTEQVHAAGRLSRLQESRALLDSLKQL